MIRANHYSGFALIKLLALAIIAGMAFAPATAHATGDILYIADAGTGSIKRFNAKTGTLIDTFITGVGIVEGLACIDEKLYVVQSAPASMGGLIETYDWRTGKFIANFVTGLEYAQAIDVSKDGKVLYAAEYGKNRLLAFDTETKNLLHETAYAEVFGITVAKDGALYVSGKIGGGVDRYDSQLNLLGNFIAPGSHGLQRPVSTIIAPDDTLYILDSLGRNVQHYDALGNYLNTLSPPDPSFLTQSFDMAIGPDGNLYVVSADARCVSRFDLGTQSYLDTFIGADSSGAYPKFLLFDTEHIFTGRPLPPIDTGDNSNVPEAGTMAVIGIAVVVTGGTFLRRRKSKKPVSSLSF